ncbi:hypothetical protein, partial [Catenulispora rubra]|uniref:hypothetical protein n=1 Tax=Catenulispora rubra TaxID=280293 RepID=UPI001E431146
MELFEVLGVGLAESERGDGVAELLDTDVDVWESEGVGVAAREVELPSTELSDVTAPPGCESALESVAPVVTTTAPMIADVAAKATAALAAKCEAADRAPALGIRRWEWLVGPCPGPCACHD